MAASAPLASRAAAAGEGPQPSALRSGRRLDIGRREKVVRVDEAELSCYISEARGFYQFDEVLVFHFCAVY